MFMYDIAKEAERLGREEGDRLYEKSGVMNRDLPEGHGHVVVNFTKNREGETPRLELDFDKGYQTFHPLSGEEY